MVAWDTCIDAQEGPITQNIEVDSNHLGFGFDPVVWMFDDHFSKIAYSYFNRGVLEIEMEGTYADRDADIKHMEYSWNHSLSEVVNALTSHGLQIQFLNEHDYSPYNCFANTVENGNGGYFIKGYEGVLPMVYSIKAEKAAISQDKN